MLYKIIRNDVEVARYNDYEQALEDLWKRYEEESHWYAPRRNMYDFIEEEEEEDVWNC